MQYLQLSDIKNKSIILYDIDFLLQLCYSENRTSHLRERHITYEKKTFFSHSNLY